MFQSTALHSKELILNQSPDNRTKGQFHKKLNFSKTYLYNKTHWQPLTRLGMDDCKNSYNSEVIKTESSLTLDKSFVGLGRSVASAYASESLLVLPHAQSLSSSSTLTLPCLFMLNGLFSLFCIPGLHAVLHSSKISAGSIFWSKSSLICLQGIDRSFLSSRCCWLVLDPSELAKGLMKEKNDVKDFPRLEYDLA